MQEKAWISASMSQKMKDDLDEYIEINGFNRSEFVRYLIRNEIYGDDIDETEEIN